jgi:hypothetical protein
VSSFKLFDPVGALQVYQVIPQTLENFCVSILPILLQVLANQVDHGCECAEVVVFLDMELYARFGHTLKYGSGQLKYF